jgi:hypothetical protein
MAYGIPYSMHLATKDYYVSAPLYFPVSRYTLVRWLVKNDVWLVGCCCSAAHPT